jgi:lipoic acid synthetase
VRWLGRVAFRDAHALQRGLFVGSADHLLLLEHPHTYTLGVRADPANVLVEPASVGAELVTTDRGGDVTYHGPGQLVGYPVLSVAGKRGGGMADTVAYVRTVEQVVIDALATLGLADVGRLEGHPGVWVAPGSAHPRKIAAIGVRLSRGRSMHGFALNVDPDLSFFDHIVPCGIADKAVTSLAAEGIDVPMRAVVDAVTAAAVSAWAPDGRWERQDQAWRVAADDLSAFTRGDAVPRPGAPESGGAQRVHLRGRLAEAGLGGGLAVSERKPAWLRAPLRLADGYQRVGSLLRDLDLVTVCEEAGCPNRSECWNDGTATFMLNGERCTRACGFCLVDTRRPEPLDATEPTRVAEAVERLGLDFAVLTAVARDDLADGGAAAFAATVEAIRRRCPGTLVEVLIPDCKGEPAALGVIFDSRPDVLNHNLETVLRLQRAVRPSASYARSLAVLARAKAAGLVTKSGMIVGMGETVDEVHAALVDLAAVGVDIVTVGQYLRPTAAHLPVVRWWRPDEFDELRALGLALGIGHVEASPFTRSSHHAKEAAASVRSQQGTSA